MKTGLCLEWSWAQLKTAWVWLLAAAILYLATRWPLTIISPRILQTYKCLWFSHQGEGTVSWPVQEHFVSGGGVVGFCISPGRKPTGELEYCSLPGQQSPPGPAEPSRASRAPEQTPVDTAVLPSAAGLAHLPADTVMCARCIPSPARAGGCTECPQSAVSRREPFSQEFLRLRLHFQWHSSFHSEVVLLCHLASSRYRSALLYPKENTATSQLWAMTLLKKWMEKLVLLQYCYTFFLIQSTYFYLTFGLFKPFRIV